MVWINNVRGYDEINIDGEVYELVAKTLQEFGEVYGSSDFDISVAEDVSFVDGEIHAGSLRVLKEDQIKFDPEDLGHNPIGAPGVLQDIDIRGSSVFKLFKASTWKNAWRAAKDLPRQGKKVISSVKSLLSKGDDAARGGLSNSQARAWSSEQFKSINTNVKPTQANARSVVNQRNSLKQQARDLMSDRKAAAQLDKDYPIQNYDYYYNKYSNQGYSGEVLYQRIIQGGKTPNAGVNQKFEIDP